MSYIGPLPVTSLLKFPLKKDTGNSYQIQHWISLPWNVDHGEWILVKTHPSGHEALFSVVSSLLVPGQYLNSMFPRIDFSRTLCLKFGDQNCYSYIWYDASPLLPQVWLMQPFFSDNPGSLGTTAEGSVNIMEEVAVSHGTYCYLDELKKFTSPSSEITSLKLTNSSSNPICIHYYDSSGNFQKANVAGKKDCELKNINIPRTDLSPGNNFTPFFINIFTTENNSPESKIVYKKGIIYDQNGYPYLAQAIPVHGNLGASLRIKIISDGNILVIGTMDLDPG